MYDTNQDLLAALRAGPIVLKALLQAALSGEASTSLASGEWGPVEIVCHLRDAEERALERMRMMRDLDDPFLPGYDQETWARERDYAHADLVEALADFTRFRLAHAEELAALSPEQWLRPGWHEEVGAITLLNHTIHLVCHDFVHLDQLAQPKLTTE